MGVILMLMTIGGLFIAAILLIISYFAKLNWLRTFVLGGVTVWFVGYVILFLTASIFSEEQNLGLNEPKEFCGFYLDCHLHTSVSDVRKTKTIGDKTAQGEFYIVKIKVFSDAKRAELGLHSPQLYVIDENGRRYSRFEEAENPAPPFDQKVPADGSFEKEIVFDLPTDVKKPRLDVAEGIGIDKVIEAVLIGDEDSLFHKRIRFNLEPQPTQAGLN